MKKTLALAALAVAAVAPARVEAAPDTASRATAFTPAGVTACLRRARTSVGVAMVDRDPEAASRFRARAVLSFWLLQSDYGLPGVKIAFASSPSDTLRLQRTAFARIAARQGPRFARSLVFKRRANVVFYYQRSTLREVVRIADGCLGGPPYRGNGGTPPPPGLPPG